jgi:hypothetical protein
VLPVLATAVQLGGAFALGAPSPRIVALVRATVAAGAGLALVRSAVGRARFPAVGWAVSGTLWVCAGLSLLAFANLGRPQSWDHGNRRPSFVHYRDLRVYFPTAKYFEELGYDGLYAASVGAYAEGAGVSLESLGKVPLRDLRTHAMTTVAEARRDIDAVKARFTPERWAALETDLRYFREAMGRDYLDSLNDHGANATPVWLAIARGVFARAGASARLFEIGALIDPALLLLLFAAVWRAFGMRPMLLCAIVFGANDFTLLGTNWAGATLRHDWLVYLGLGVCALRVGWWRSAGALLALSASIRAFPAVTFVALLAPAAFWAWQHRASPRAAHGYLLRVAQGAAICAAVCAALSMQVLSPAAFRGWLDKVALLHRDAHANHVGLRALIAGSDLDQAAVLAGRLPLYVVALLVCCAAVAVACRGRRPEQAALLGTILIPIVFLPANYYIHFIFLLPLLARHDDSEPLAPGALAVSGPLLAVCVAQSCGGLDPDVARHFQYSTALLFAGLTAIVAAFIRGARA